MPKVIFSYISPKNYTLRMITQPANTHGAWLETKYLFSDRDL